MRTQPNQTELIEIPSSALVVFLCTTFAITWGLVGVYIMVPEWSAATLGEISGSHPFFFLATWSPAIAAPCVIYVYAECTDVGIVDDTSDLAPRLDVAIANVAIEAVR